MTGASFIGFGVVFLLVCWSASVVLAVASTRLTSRGPAVERRAAALAAFVPVALAIAVTAILLIESFVGVDHCPTHDHHAHLCLQHGLAWADRPWAIVTLLGAGAVIGTRGALMLGGFARGAWMLRRLHAVAGSSDVRIVESDRVFCFVAGIVRPTIFVSSATRTALSDDEWTAMLAHERSHIAHRDLVHRLGIELLLLFAAPIATTVIRERWDAATERLRDADAADVTDAESVASALVTMARRAIQPAPRAVAAFTPTGDQLLAARVHSLLDGAPRGEAEARRLARAAIASTVMLFLLAAVFAEPLHHALETLLG